MTADTQNALTDFDMCLALAQKAINSQMQAAWDIWIARSEFSNIAEMQDFALVSIFSDESNISGLEAEMAPLSVTLYVPDAKLGQVQVTLHLQEGDVYLDKSGSLRRSERRKMENAVEDLIQQDIDRGVLAENALDDDDVFDDYTQKYKKAHPELFREAYAIKDWRISFLTDLDQKPCDLKTLQKIDPNVHDAAQDVIQQSGLPDSVFSIEYLFMKFTQVNLILSDNKDIEIPSDVPDDVRTEALLCLNKMLQGNEGEFMLGTVVRRSKSKSRTTLPTFALTDFIFNVKADEPAWASTLSYLGMFSGRPLPANQDAARLKLEDNWVRPKRLDGSLGLISGTMVISKDSFFNRYLMPKFTAELEVDPKQDGLSWTYTLPKQVKKDTKTDAFKRVFSTRTNAKLKITIKPGTGKLKLSGKISSSANYDSYIPIFKEKEAWIRLAGYQKIHTSVNLTGSGGTQDFQIDIDIPEDDYFGKIVVTKEETGGTASLTKDGNIFASIIEGLGGTTVNDTLGDLQKKHRDLMRKTIDKALKQIDMSLNNQSFIPPGGGVFTFQRLRFSDAGDLLLDVIYKAP